MNLTTERLSGTRGGPSEIPAVYRPWLLLFTLATIGLVFLSPVADKGSQLQVSEGFHITLFPWLHAVGITIANGLDVFSGTPVTPPTEGQRASILVGLLLSLVIGPTLLLIPWRAMKKSATVRRWHPPALLLGMVLVASTSVPSFYLALRQWQVYQAIKEAQSKGLQRDAMIHSLQQVALNARAFRIVPVSEGGGSGSFRGYVVPESFAASQTHSCEAGETRDTVLTLVARSTSNYALTITGTATASGEMRFSFNEPGD